MSERFQYSWTAGASSAEALGPYGWFQFSVPRGVAGVRVGLVANDLSTNPYESKFVLVFNGTSVYVNDSGQSTALGRYVQSDKWYIVRWADVLLVCKGAEGVHRHARVPKDLPGKVVYVSSGQNLAINQFLDASLLAPSDRVIGAAVENFTPVNGVDCKMRPMVMRAFEEGYAGAHIRFRPIRMALVGNKENRAELKTRALMLRAFDSGYAGVNTQMRGMLLESNGQGTALNGVDATMLAPKLTITAPGSLATPKSAPMRITAVEAAHYASVSMKFARPSLFAMSNTVVPPEPFGITIYVEIPTPTLSVQMDVDWPAQPGDDVLDVTDTVRVSELVIGTRYTLVDEVATATDVIQASGAIIATIEDRAYADSQWFAAASIDLESAAKATEFTSYQADLVLTSGAQAADLLAPLSVGAMDAYDGAKALDGALPYVFFDVADGAGAFDSLEFSHDQLVDESAMAVDGYELASMRAGDITDAAKAGESLDMFGASSISVIDGASASGELVTKNSGLVAWTMNTDTGAVAWWDNWAFTDMAVVGGRIFACGPDGLVEVQGGRDGADMIDAKLEYGFSELGGYTESGLPQSSEQRKRIQSLMFGYHANGLLNATVETYGQGNGAYRYRMEPRRAHQPTNNRVMVGKGLSARYWRIGVENRCGCDFEVHSISAEVAKSQRRL